jgi:hypothetical protein
MTSASVLMFLPAGDCPTPVDSQLSSAQLNSTQLNSEFIARVTLRLAVYRQSVRLGDNPLEIWPVILFSNWTLAVITLCKTLSEERMGLLYTIAADPRKRSLSQVRVPRDSWPHFIVSDSRLPQPGGPGPRIYMPQEQDDPVIPPGTGFHFRRLLRLAGLRRRYSTPPPLGRSTHRKHLWDVDIWRDNHFYTL